MSWQFADDITIDDVNWDFRNDVSGNYFGYTKDGKTWCYKHEIENDDNETEIIIEYWSRKLSEDYSKWRLGESKQSLTRIAVKGKVTAKHVKFTAFSNCGQFLVRK